MSLFFAIVGGVIGATFGTAGGGLLGMAFGAVAGYLLARQGASAQANRQLTYRVERLDFGVSNGLSELPQTLHSTRGEADAAHP